MSSGSSSAPTRIELHLVRTELRSEHSSAHGTETFREVILVQWCAADGSVGWSECPTLQTSGYATETTEEAWRALVEVLVPAVMAGGEPQRHRWVAAPAALEDARLDAWLRCTATSLRAHLGASRTALERCAVLAGIGATPSQLVASARSSVDGGAEMVKLKIRPGADLDVLHAVIDALDVPVAADANGSYRSAEDLRALDELGLAYLEQPLAPSCGLEEFARLRSILRTPIALDESLPSVAAVRAALAVDALDVVSIKPARLGGIEAAAVAARAARDAGVSAFVGGMLELGIGRAGAAAVAAMDSCDLPTDLGPSAAYVQRDVCAPLTLDDAGRLRCPSGPGIGRLPDAEALAEMTVRHWATA